ncbi:MAG: hypothetical protein OSJ43_09265, partial [Oscillospiraceae bacterium]|nr:hypothetical protein [Oscillospiraceae bacterium]
FRSYKSMKAKTNNFEEENAMKNFNEGFHMNSDMSDEKPNGVNGCAGIPYKRSCGYATKKTRYRRHLS